MLLRLANPITTPARASGNPSRQSAGPTANLGTDAQLASGAVLSVTKHTQFARTASTLGWNARLLGRPRRVGRQLQERGLLDNLVR